MKLLRLIFAARTSLPRVLPLMRDARVPMWLKGALVLAAIVFASPLDPLSDIPVLGLVDDAAILIVLANAFVWASERSVRPRAVRPQPAPAGPQLDA